MLTVPKTVSMGDLKNHSGDVFAALEEGPALVLSRATPKAVIVSPSDWNDLAFQISNLEFEVNALRARFDKGEGDWLTLNEVRVGLREKGLLDDEDRGK